MRVFPSPSGDGIVYFDNLVSPEGTPIGYDPVARAFAEKGPFCANREQLGCNWVAPEPEALCMACAMTALAPDTTGEDAHRNWARTEADKRWVLDNLRNWGWFGADDTGPAPVFHLLAEGAAPVVMGHAEGVVTITIEESDPVQQITRREELDESYRTMIGHMRHELAHMIWWRLGIEDDFTEGFRDLFGDESADYAAALERHYADGPPADWQDRHLTPYASAHPHEDWAETTAHLLHLIDIVDSAAAAGLVAPELRDAAWSAYDEPDAERLLTVAAAIALKINHVNRSMGLSDLYPFVLTETTREKLAFAHRWLRRGPVAPAAEG